MLMLERFAANCQKWWISLFGHPILETGNPITLHCERCTRPFRSITHYDTMCGGLIFDCKCDHCTDLEEKKLTTMNDELLAVGLLLLGTCLLALLLPLWLDKLLVRLLMAFGAIVGWFFVEAAIYKMNRRIEDE